MRYENDLRMNRHPGLVAYPPVAEASPDVKPTRMTRHSGLSL